MYQIKLIALHNYAVRTAVDPILPVLLVGETEMEIRHTFTILAAMVLSFIVCFF